jgi:hypothetical protein
VRTKAFRLLLAALIAAGAPSAIAERFLTIPEAHSLCFAQADRFEAQDLRPTPEQTAAIEKLSSVKVPKRPYRLWIARQGKTVLGVLIIDQAFTKHELVDYAVAISPTGRILQVEILEYRERFGSDIRSPKWLGQFAGKTSASPLKLNEDIYNISGATISCRHVTAGIKRVLAACQTVVLPRLRAAGELPDSATSQPR